MFRYLFAGLLVVAIVLGAYVGCGPRMAVAGKKVLAEIDKVLGKLNVQLEKVEQAHAKLEKETQGMRKEQIGAQHSLNKLIAEKEEVTEKIAKYKSELGRLSGFMTDAKPSGKVEINGKEITEGKLEILAQSIIKKVKAAERVLVRNATLSEAWTKSLTVLKNNWDTSKSQLKMLADQIEEIKAKKSALDAMKEASTIVGNESSISDKFNDLTKDVDSLLTEVDIEMLVETEKVEERMAASDSDVSLDEILGADTSTDDTLSEIEAILGSGN